MAHSLALRLHAKPMLALLLAQFLSALADNALLISAVASMKLLGQLDHISWVQSGFLVPFIVLAPYVGKIADALPKGRVMLMANTIKLVGTVCMAWGMNPVMAYLIVGIGATLYSPAKYGILSQLFHAENLVKANALLESSTIVAILLGVVVGGWLADWSVMGAIWLIAGIYLLAALVNLMIPRLPPSVQHQNWDMRMTLHAFWHSLRLLWHDAEARVSLIGTGLFWGSGATLRLMLFVWVPLVLHITNNHTPANMMGVLSMGIVVGAALAWWAVGLTTMHRAFVAGMFIGPSIILLAFQTGVWATDLCLLAMGVAGGMFVVPLNALLQARGQYHTGVGQALSIQNFVENMSMLTMVTVYGWVERVPIFVIILAFGVLMTLGVGALLRESSQIIQRGVRDE
jgi:LPLT family lysophospholipid transporter-like MFS transporter